MSQSDGCVAFSEYRVASCFVLLFRFRLPSPLSLIVSCLGNGMVADEGSVPSLERTGRSGGDTLQERRFFA